MTRNADDDDHDSLVGPLIVYDNHDRLVYSLVDDKNAVDDDHDRLVDPLVANYLAKQFACAQTNRLKYPLLQIHSINFIIKYPLQIQIHHNHHLHHCCKFTSSSSLMG